MTQLSVAAQSVGTTGPPSRTSLSSSSRFPGPAGGAPSSKSHLPVPGPAAGSSRHRQSSADTLANRGRTPIPPPPVAIAPKATPPAAKPSAPASRPTAAKDQSLWEELAGETDKTLRADTTRQPAARKSGPYARPSGMRSRPQLELPESNSKTKLFVILGFVLLGIVAAAACVMALR